MKIGINLFLTSPKSVTGGFVYIRNILPALFEADRENYYYLLGDWDTIRFFNSQLNKYSNVSFHIIDIKRDILINPVRACRKFYAKIRRNYGLREKIISSEVASFFKQQGISLYFSPSSAIFPKDISGVKIVTTILDLQHEYFPENFSPAYLKRRIDDCRFAVERSDRVISISNYTKKTIIEKYGIPSAKISTVYLAQQEFEGEDNISEMPDEFVYYPAALWSHKNHSVLIKAFGLIKDCHPNLHIICTGTVKNEKLKKELKNLAESLGVKDRVIFRGYISNTEMCSLYKKAKILVFPSAFEGFGMPIIEAFSFGLPVIASDNSSITEIVANAGILVKTGDEKTLARKISQVLNDGSLREDLEKKGLERAKTFSWEKAARQTVEIFNSIS